MLKILLLLFFFLLYDDIIRASRKHLLAPLYLYMICSFQHNLHFMANMNDVLLFVDVDSFENVNCRSLIVPMVNDIMP